MPLVVAYKSDINMLHLELILPKAKKYLNQYILPDMIFFSKNEINYYDLTNKCSLIEL